MAQYTMDDYIEELLAEFEPQQQDNFFGLDNHAPAPVRPPVGDLWVELLDDAKTQFEVDGAATVFSTFRVEAEDPLQIGDVDVAPGIEVRGGRMALDARMTDGRAAQILATIPDTDFILRVKFLRERAEGDWTAEDKLDPVRAGRARGQGVVTVNRNTRPGALTGLDRPYYENGYPVTAVVYGLYTIRNPDPNNLQPLRDGDFNCVAQRVVEHFEGALRGHGLTPTRRQKIAGWEERVHDTGATVDDVAELEKILKRSIILTDIAGEEIFNSGKYQGQHRQVELIVHNGHAWPRDLHFPQAREVNIYEGDVWSAIQEATHDEPTAVWVLGGQEKQLSADQFVLQDGRTFRTQQKHDDIVRACAALGAEDLADRVFGENHAASVVARERNEWKPTPASILDDVQKSCVEHGHGGLWNAAQYHVNEIVSIDMKSCYPASFTGQGECQPYFERFGHPRSRMTRVAVNGPLPGNIGTGFAQVRTWAFNEKCHPLIAAWDGKHLAEQGWVPTALLAYMLECDILTHLEVTEALIAFKKQTEVWLPENRDQACSVIGKFTQGAKTDGKRLTRRLVTDQGELEYLVRDCRQNGTLVGAPERCPLGHILTYYDGSQPQYTHLRASMLAYAHINLLSMLQRFTAEEAVRVATDSLYVKTDAMYKLQAVTAFVPKLKCHCGGSLCIDCLLDEEYQPPVLPAQWRDKGEQLCPPQDHAAYEPEHWQGNNDIQDSTDLRFDDPLTT